MAFTTLPFLIFFASLFSLYYAVSFIPILKGKGIQKWLILVANLVFYAWASPWFLLFLGISSALVYGAGMVFSFLDQRAEAELLEKAEKKKILSYKKPVLILTIVIVLALLIVPKYSSFVLSNVNYIFGTEFTLSLMLPLGLSFYTFQNIGYLLNVYWGKYPLERNPLKYLTYISYFPHVLQGPLEDYEEVAGDLFSEHEFDLKAVEEGFTRVLLGVMKKFWIATQVGLLITPYLTGEKEAFGILVPILAIGYAVQMYADFSGYMDIACGTSKMLGIRIAENFDTPYFSTSIASYWRRWHSTLGAWFRTYLFYPLMRTKALSSLRKKLKKNKYLASTLPTSIALFIVWLLIGLWHGGDWSYIIHGLLHGSIIIMSTFLEPVYAWWQKKFPFLTNSFVYKGFQIVRTFSLVCLGYLFFAPGNLSITLSLFENIPLSGAGEILSTLWQEDPFAIVSALLGTFVLFLLDLGHVFFRDKKLPFPMLLWILLLLATLVFGKYSEADASQFLYFKF